MDKFIVDLNIRSESGKQASMTAYILEKTNFGPRPVIVICPGGGYDLVCENTEGEPIAMAYVAAGFHAVVLDYTTAQYGKHPAPILELAEAIKYCRKMSYEWQINPNQIAVCGFSAGGHLAASISTLWNSEKVFTKEEIKSELHRPNASILCYSVISSGKYGHKESISRVSGSSDENSKIWKLLSLEKQVNDNTSPAFIWHTFYDSVVMMENSMLYATALKRHNIPFELHIYPRGDHGLCLATQNIARAKSALPREYMWHKLSVDWLYELFDII